ncbi:OLC1v1000572C1 [Oldenlandia corymbosa var. corymbosa]|uniref:OLC1v1000572C1 n=1 Tax=Oldenlandia corymbosa var. corymbosa TaxID=529605 RepID=A0AAV1D5P5_OLDCO|nr:OLC1v1000572C1 [Oldenlandia corymbosa var. corymbosa]
MTFLQKNTHSNFYPFPNNSTNINKTVDQISTIKSILFSPVPPLHQFTDTMTKRDPGGIGFIDDVGGSVNGLMSCTESLGFESSDERRVDDEIGILDLNYEKEFLSNCSSGNLRLKREHVKREVKNFPPPLSSLDQNGKPTFFLRPVRRDGKLELQEVKINRPEVLCASREDGRLRLHFVSNEDEQFDDQEEEEFEEEEVIVGESDEEEEEETIEEDGYIEDEEAELVEERAEGWRIPVNQHGDGGSDGGFLRCHEMVSHHQIRRHQHHHHHGHHHHDMHVWSRHCVTIR